MNCENNSFINVTHIKSDKLSETANNNSGTDDPLQELGTESNLPRCYKLDTIVFAEPLVNIWNDENALKDKEELNQVTVVDNIIIRKETGKKYNKYLMDLKPSQLQCPQSNCTRIFATTKLLKAHIRKVHCADRQKYICDQCGRGFSARYLLQRHVSVHSGVMVECPVCDVKLRGRTGLTNHLRSHLNIRAHECGVCKKKFTRASTCATHVKFVHKQGTLACDQCEQRFSSRNQWSMHMKTHRNDSPG